MMKNNILLLAIFIVCSCSKHSDQVVFYDAYTPGLHSPISRTEKFIIENFEPLTIDDLQILDKVQVGLEGLRVNTCTKYNRSSEPVLIAYSTLNRVESKIVFDGFSLNVNGKQFCVDTNFVNLFYKKSGNYFDYSFSCLCSK